MAILRVTTSYGEVVELNVDDIEHDTAHYQPWRIIKHSPSNYPDSTGSYVPAGSTVMNPTVLSPQEIFGKQIILDCRQDVNYVVQAIRDMDITMHVARHVGSSNPVPHWNFKVFRTIRYDKDNEQKKEYLLGPNADAHVAKCEWVEVELLSSGRRLIPKEKFYWEKPS